METTTFTSTVVINNDELIPLAKTLGYLGDEIDEAKEFISKIGKDNLESICGAWLTEKAEKARKQTEDALKAYVSSVVDVTYE